MKELISNKILIFLFALIHLFKISKELEYKKNKEIKLTPHSNPTRLIEINNIQFIKNKIESKNSNFLLIFVSNFCVECQDYISNLEKASSYEIATGFEFYKLNCTEYRGECSESEINSFPKIQVFLRGQMTRWIPYSPELESILEYVDKINTPDVIHISKSIKFYSDNYGDVSFILASREENDEINKCYSNLAKSVEYKPLFYFFSINENKYANREEIKLPAIIVDLFY